MGKRKTHEEYVAELTIKNPTVEVVEQYVGAHIKIKHHCLLHDIYWDIKPHNVLHGQGCKNCQKERYSKKRTKTHEQYVEELKNVNPYIIALEKYINAKTPILHKCLVHNINWNARPSDLLDGGGCYECRNEKIGNSLRKSHERYIEEVRIVNPNVLVIDKYNGANIPILHRCLIHNIDWNITPASVLEGAGCPECHSEKISNVLKKTHEQYVEELKIANPYVIAIETYVNSLIPILHKCLIHNVDWETTPTCALRGYGCPECHSEKIRNYKLKTHEQYVEEIKNANQNIVVIGKYMGANMPILHKCKICGNKWFAYPNNILKGIGCPCCNESKGEKEICFLLDKHKIEYVKQKRFYDCRDTRQLPFDFYLPYYNVAIEYNGKQHYEPIEYFGGEKTFKIQQLHDKIKEEYCRKNNIGFLAIPYYKNIEEELNNFLFI